jgi:transcriptional regulator with PAS, ATPase and Fis domain
LSEVERKHVREILKQEQGNKVQAAKILGISRRSLYRLIEKYALESGKRGRVPEDGKAG